MGRELEIFLKFGGTIFNREYFFTKKDKKWSNWGIQMLSIKALYGNFGT
jgi:hypothetical protein